MKMYLDTDFVMLMNDFEKVMRKYGLSQSDTNKMEHMIYSLIVIMLDVVDDE